MRLQLKILFEIKIFPIPQGVALAYLQTGISGVFVGGFDFENLYFFAYCSQLLYFLGC